MAGAHRHAVLHPLARHQPGALLPLPSADEAVLLGLRGRLRRPGLLRLAERRCGACVGIPLVWVARLGTLYYFAFFWLIMPIVGPDRNARRSFPPPSPNPCSATPPRPLPSENTTCADALRLGTSLALAFGLLAAAPAMALDTTRLPPKDVDFSFEGPFGTYDRAPCSAASRSIRKSARPATA